MLKEKYAAQQITDYQKLLSVELWIITTVIILYAFRHLKLIHFFTLTKTISWNKSNTDCITLGYTYILAYNVNFIGNFYMYYTFIDFTSVFN